MQPKKSLRFGLIKNVSMDSPVNRCIRRKEGIMEWRQRLSFKDQRLSDATALSEYGIERAGKSVSHEHPALNHLLDGISLSLAINV